MFDDVRADEAATVIASALSSDPGWLGPTDVAALLDSYGIRRVDERLADTPVEAAEQAAALGFPVALKASAEGLVHKTEVGAVRVGLTTADEVESEARDMAERLRQAGVERTSFVVQRMVTSAVEIIVGVVNDEVFGPIAAVGAGGTTAEVLGDVSVRLTPLSDTDVSEMIRSLRIAPLLAGYRGARASDVAALEETVLRVGALVEAHAEITELDCNPVAVTADGAFVLDARIRIGPSAPEPLFGSKA